MNTRRVVIALGSNLGDRENLIHDSASMIASLPGITLQTLSSLHKSEPAYNKEQPEFLNAVLIAKMDASLSPLGLLEKLKSIEAQLGRTLHVEDDVLGSAANRPRCIDLDIVDIEGVVSDDPELFLPHPLAYERDFVVDPLFEIAPDYVFADGSKVADAKTVAEAACVNAAEDVTCAISAAEAACVKTSNEDAEGILSVCSTPIGNMGDISIRLLKTLTLADVVLAEDTRVARRLLTHLNLRKPIERCDEHTIRAKTPDIIARLGAGARIAYLSDAGTPGVSDPGMYLVAAARAACLRIEVIPGASAVLAALASVGFEGSAFYFGGFLPRKDAARRAYLQELVALDAVLVFYESPHRCVASLATIAEVFPEREAALARELTKLHEEVLRAPSPELATRIAERAAEQPLKGEVVLLIGASLRTDKHKRVHKDKYAR